MVNGKKGPGEVTIIVLGFVPCFRLTVGYLFHPDGSMDSVSSSEFELYDHAEDGRPPTHLGFRFSAGTDIA